MSGITAKHRLTGRLNTTPGNSGAGSVKRQVDITLPAANWVCEGKKYSQVVEIHGITPYHQVNLTPSDDQLVIFHDKDLTFTTKNEDGVVTVTAIGQKPSNDYVIQAKIEEVSV